MLEAPLGRCSSHHARVRRTLLLLGALAAVALTALAITVVVDAIDQFSGGARIGKTRTPVPGQRDATLEERKYVVYYEVDSGFAGGFDKTREIVVPAELDLAIRRDGDGPPLPLDDYGGDFEVSSGGRTAQAWRTVEVPRAGNYRISAGPEVRAAAPAIVLGRPVSGRVLRLVFGIAALLAGLGLGGLVGAIAVGLRLRARSQPVTPPALREGGGQPPA
jgi:hypothetical protein